MKKTAGVIVKILAGFILLILILLFTVPVLFKEKIRTEVEKAIAASIKADVKFEDYSIGFFKNFPNLSFSLTDLSVVGVDKFDNDTLASIKSFSLVFDLSSLFKKSGYEVKSIIVDRADIKTIVLKDGSANWDISRDTSTAAAPQNPEGASSMKILLKKVSITNSSISYLDAESDIQAWLNDLDLNMKGDMTSSETDMQILGRSGEFTFSMEGMKYLNNTVLETRTDMLANFDSMKFTFRENYLSINDMKLNFSGSVAMPGADISTDIQFKTAQTAFSSLLSLIPAVYMKDYKDLKTSGEFTLSGTAKGIYSDADSTIPDLALSISVKDGVVSYPSLPEQIKDINIKSNLFIDGRVMDKSTFDIDLFHFELAGNPFDMNLKLKTPVSDPDFNGSMNGHIDLSALSKALPMDSIKLSGLIDISVKMAGRMSALDKQQYESFSASGKISIKDMIVAMQGYPEVKINRAGFEFSPAYAALTDASINIGSKSDFTFSGRLSNYIPYFLRNQTIKGNLSMHSRFLDAEEIMSEMATDTTAVKDTAALAVMKVPENIDFDFDALIDEFRYGKIDGKEVKGHVIVRNGILSLRETGMNILNGTLSLNADYDTRDTLKPVMKADMDVQNVDIRDAFTAFNTVRKLAPAAKGIDGKISAKLGFQSLLGRDMMPVVSSISGEGKLKSDEITLVESETFDKMKEILKLGDKYNNTFKDINVSFRINDGRIYVSPFDIRTGNLKMNISGDQGIDQTLNYLVKTEMPRSDLGSSVNSLIDNLAAQAAAFGINYKPAEILKINLKVTGTFAKPAVAPVFGSSSNSSTAGKESVTKEATKAAVDLGKEKARAEAEAEAARLVREAEDKGQLIRDEAARTAESIKKEADTQARKLTDDASKKSSLEKMAAQKSADALRKNADKKTAQLVKEADVQASNLVEEAKKQGEELVKKIQ
jgi:hypothetical protein